MHQRLQRTCYIPVVDEEVLFDVELWIETFQITRMIIFPSMAQRQVLRARRSADRISLYKPHPLKSLIKRGWLGKVACDRKPSQIIKRDWHGRTQSMPQRRIKSTKD